MRERLISKGDREMKRLIPTIAIGLALGYYAGFSHADRNAAQVLQAQWDGETKRLEYAYSTVDRCVSRECLEAWSELIENPQPTPIVEDDPQWDCRIHGDGICGKGD